MITPTKQERLIRSLTRVWDLLAGDTRFNVQAARTITHSVLLELEEQPLVHEHRPQYPSGCTGCEHLAADLASRLPIGLLPMERMKRFLQEDV